MHKYFLQACFVLLIAVVFFVYTPGLADVFLFDDAPNLKALGEQGAVNNWHNLKQYLSSGWSGPTGRPISLLSFLVDDNTWPSVATPFKYTSILLHLLTGLLLLWATYLLLKQAGYQSSSSRWIALISAAFWLLHPLWVSTTLYVVQRMTILSALFMLIGLVGYLKGRHLLASSQPASTKRAYIQMTVSLGVGAILATLSKENGALLPLLVLLVEIFLQRMNNQLKPARLWVVVFLGIPACILLAYLASRINFSTNIWPSRPFNQVERLLTESRIMWSYLGDLWLPRVEGSGLYQDGIVISKTLFQPLTTLWATLGWLAVVAALPILYKRTPLVWLALVFFLCGHLIESTVIGLELHFEHRNYAPSFFMFLPLAASISKLATAYRPRTAIAASVIILCFLSLLTWQRSSLWSDGDNLQTYWSINTPESPRGRNYIIGRLVNEKKYADALAWADKSFNELPNSSLVTIAWLRMYVNTRRATTQHFEMATERLLAQPFDAQTVKGLRTLVDDALTTPELVDYHKNLLGLLYRLELEGPYRNFPLFIQLNTYNKARIYLLLGDLERAQSNYLLAIDLYANASAAMQFFSEAASANQWLMAKKILNATIQLIKENKIDTAPLGQDYYLHEASRLIGELDQVINEQSISEKPEA